MSKHKKKISIVSAYDFRGSSAPANRLRNFAKILSENEMHITVLNLTDTSNNQKNTECANVKIINVKKYSTLSPSFLKRFFIEFYNSILLIRTSNKLKCDFQIISIPYMNLIVASIFSKHRNKTLIDIRDLVWTYLPDGSYFQKFTKNLITLLMNNSLKLFPLLSCTNAYEQRYLIDTINKFPELIHNGIDLDRFNLVAKTKNIKNNYRKKVLYVGNVGIAQRLDIFVNIAKKLPHFDFELVGGGTDFDRVSRIAAEKKCDNLNIIGEKSADFVMNSYSSCDILFAQLSNNFQTAIPSKLYEYLSTGKPIVYSGKGSAIKFLSTFENVRVCESCDEDKIIDAIEFLAKNTSTNSLKNVEYIKNNFIRDYESAKIINMISKFLVQ